MSKYHNFFLGGKRVNNKKQRGYIAIAFGMLKSFILNRKISSPKKKIETEKRIKNKIGADIDQYLVSMSQKKMADNKTKYTKHTDLEEVGICYGQY